MQQVLFTEHKLYYAFYQVIHITCLTESVQIFNFKYDELQISESLSNLSKDYN